MANIHLIPPFPHSRIPTTIIPALRQRFLVVWSGCLIPGGITLRSGRRGFAIYREGKVIEQYTAMGAGVK